jgi:hypothetical protein
MGLVFPRSEQLLLVADTTDTILQGFWTNRHGPLGEADIPGLIRAPSPCGTRKVDGRVAGQIKDWIEGNRIATVLSNKLEFSAVRQSPILMPCCTQVLAIVQSFLPVSGLSVSRLLPHEVREGVGNRAIAIIFQLQ